MLILSRTTLILFWCVTEQAKNAPLSLLSHPLFISFSLSHTHTRIDAHTGTKSRTHISLVLPRMPPKSKRPREAPTLKLLKDRCVRRKRDKANRQIDKQTSSIVCWQQVGKFSTSHAAVAFVAVVAVAVVATVAVVADVTDVEDVAAVDLRKRLLFGRKRQPGLSSKNHFAARLTSGHKKIEPKKSSSSQFYESSTGLYLQVCKNR